MQREYQTLTLSRPADHVLEVVLDRPAAANAMNTQMGEDLLALWSALYRDAEDVRCVVVTGAGDRVFCAGADLKERHGMTDADWARQHGLFEQMIRAQMDCPVPLLAAINGACFAGGLEIALACDFSYAVPQSRFAFTEVALGIMPGAGGTQNLPRAVGVRRAKEIILTGKPFGAEEALTWGLVNRLCEPDDLLPAAHETAAAIAGNAPIATRQAKKAIGAATSTDFKTGYDLEIEAYNRLVGTDDRHEGIRAFNEKRKPSFQGR